MKRMILYLHLIDSQRILLFWAEEVKIKSEEAHQNENEAVIKNLLEIQKLSL